MRAWFVTIREIQQSEEYQERLESTHLGEKNWKFWKIKKNARKQEADIQEIHENKSPILIVMALRRDFRQQITLLDFDRI